MILNSKFYLPWEKASLFLMIDTDFHIELKVKAIIDGNDIPVNSKLSMHFPPSTAVLFPLSISAY